MLSADWPNMNNGQEELDLLNRRVKALPLSELRPDILAELLRSGDIPECPKSEKALDELLEHLQAGNNDVEKTVLPIFYGVDPSDVRNQTGCFADAFANYENKYKDEPQKVETWRAALRKLANLAGWDSNGCCFILSLL
ncbi:disease resistance protein L6-like [Argentina anserina]|uniref:disease resistance protein L6-like n=1 Tax=Argentina anserina TaxID=57926 RepID=UPI0021767152|nr:disease resistance protein L6-like [Potentilla anserina]